jgi:diguanylate cyclase (GGDEF)-like protein
MKRKLDNARSIVEGILGEIELRSAAAKDDPGIVTDFHAHLRKCREKAALDCSPDISGKYINQIREELGDEILEVLDTGKLGSIFKNRNRIRQVYKKLSIFLQVHSRAIKEAEDSILEVHRLRLVQREMVESQVAHVQEVELCENRMLRSQMLVDVLLLPFEEAMGRIIDFLEAKQIDVFLFDDDRFLTNELKTDGKIFTYNKQQQETPDLPQAIDSPTFKEVQETIYEIPLIAEGHQVGHYRILRNNTDDFDREHWIKEVSFITPIAARIIQMNQNRLHALKVYTDDLTQLHNKRKLNEQMGRLFNQFKSGQKKLFVAMLDIDKFKTLNDTYGHPAGDKVLKQVAVLIRDGVPYAYRYGGEEFCAVFYGHEKQEVLDAMESLRTHIEQATFVIDGLELKITISSGIAEFETSMNAVMDAIDRADKALYISKEDGRNRCTYYDDIKDRYFTDANRLRQRNMLLEEELAMLRKELASKKTTKNR